jgi:hypothetical protein
MKFRSPRRPCAVLRWSSRGKEAALWGEFARRCALWACLEASPLLRGGVVEVGRGWCCDDGFRNGMLT